MNETTQNPDERPSRSPNAREDLVRRVVLCAVADDDHLQDVVATGRALERSGSFRPLFVHVAEPAIRLSSPFGFAAGSASSACAALPSASATLPLSSTFDDLAQEARDAAIEFLQQAAIGADESIIAAGDPVTEINRLGAEHDAQLVVVGSHRRGLLSSALAGSVSRSLARRGILPVLIAHGSALPCTGGPVVCGVDVADDRAIIPAIRAAQLALSMNRSLVLVHVLTGERLLPPAAGWVLTPTMLRPSERQRELERRVADAVGGLPKHAVENLVIDGSSVADDLERFALDRRADLIVVGCRAGGVVRRSLGGSVSWALLRNARRPLVIVPQG